MAVSEERWTALLAYCRLDKNALEPGDTMLLETLYRAATGYLQQAGVPEPDADTARRAQYDLCVNALVLDGYDRRAANGTGAVQENPTFRRLLNQLKLTEPVSDSDTEGL